MTYGAYRPAEERDSYYWRIAHFLFPFYTMIPTGRLGVPIIARAWVPLDDEHTMFWNFFVPFSRNYRTFSRATAFSFFFFFFFFFFKKKINLETRRRIERSSTSVRD